MEVGNSEMDDKPEAGENKISRRRFIGFAWIAAAAIVLGELIGGTLAFLWPRRRGSESEKIFVAGNATDFKVGEVVPFRRERAFVLKLDGGFLAMSSVCTHLHCIVNWNEALKTFECPCHGGKFNPEGVVTGGPPPRPLDLYKIQIVAGKLVIDTTNPIERKDFDPSQLTKA